MIAIVKSAVCIGVSAHPIQIEADVGPGLPQFSIVGLPDQSVKEAKERVRSAIKNSGFSFPPDRITINLSPADIKKEGSSFDLPIAIGILIASGEISPENIDHYLFMGELALDGSAKPIKGAISAASALKQSYSFILPKQNAPEACMAREAVVYGVSSLSETIGFLNKEISIKPFTEKYAANLKSSENFPDFSDVKGQSLAKRAIEIAVAGGHNVLLIGPPGSGKSMLSQRIPSILPPLSVDEKIELTKIYSIAGLMEKPGLVEERPFRSPHHSISPAALAGGGSHPKPGEISLSHEGVLFLDEFPEFRKDVIETLRAPMEDGKILVSRAQMQITYPSRFMLVAAMNPCPCGYLGHPKRPCRCLITHIRKYQSKISGPILDRIDLHVEVPVLPIDTLSSDTVSESSEKIRQRIMLCRKIQAQRFEKDGPKLNALMRAKDLRACCELSGDSKKMMEQAVKEFGFSARVFYKILKIARTIADLGNSEKILENHLAEALQYRTLDRQFN